MPGRDGTGPLGNGPLAGRLRGHGTGLGTGVDAVITGNVGPNAHKVRAAAGVAIYQAGNGIAARDALDKLVSGELPVADAPTVSGHWA